MSLARESLASIPLQGNHDSQRGQSQREAKGKSKHKLLTTVLQSPAGCRFSPFQLCHCPLGSSVSPPAPPLAQIGGASELIPGSLRSKANTSLLLWFSC